MSRCLNPMADYFNMYNYVVEGTPLFENVDYGSIPLLNDLIQQAEGSDLILGPGHYYRPTADPRNKLVVLVMSFRFEDIDDIRWLQKEGYAFVNMRVLPYKQDLSQYIALLTRAYENWAKIAVIFDDKFSSNGLSPAEIAEFLKYLIIYYKDGQYCEFDLVSQLMIGAQLEINLDAGHTIIPYAYQLGKQAMKDSFWFYGRVYEPFLLALATEYYKGDGLLNYMLYDWDSFGEMLAPNHAISIYVGPKPVLSVWPELKIKTTTEGNLIEVTKANEFGGQGQGSSFLFLWNIIVENAVLDYHAYFEWIISIDSRTSSLVKFGTQLIVLLPVTVYSFVIFVPMIKAGALSLRINVKKFLIKIKSKSHSKKLKADLIWLYEEYIQYLLDKRFWKPGGHILVNKWINTEPFRIEKELKDIDLSEREQVAYRHSFIEDMYDYALLFMIYRWLIRLLWAVLVCSVYYPYRWILYWVWRYNVYTNMWLVVHYLWHEFIFELKLFTKDFYLHIVWYTWAIVKNWVLNYLFLLRNMQLVQLLLEVWSYMPKFLKVGTYGALEDIKPITFWNVYEILNKNYKYAHKIGHMGWSTFHILLLPFSAILAYLYKIKCDALIVNLILYRLQFQIVYMLLKFNILITYRRLAFIFLLIFAKEIWLLLLVTFIVLYILNEKAEYMLYFTLNCSFSLIKYIIYFLMMCLYYGYALVINICVTLVCVILRFKVLIPIIIATKFFNFNIMVGFAMFHSIFIVEPWLWICFYADCVIIKAIKVWTWVWILDYLFKYEAQLAYQSYYNARDFAWDTIWVDVGTLVRDKGWDILRPEWESISIQGVFLIPFHFVLYLKAALLLWVLDSPYIGMIRQSFMVYWFPWLFLNFVKEGYIIFTNFFRQVWCYYFIIYVMEGPVSNCIWALDGVFRWVLSENPYLRGVHWLIFRWLYNFLCREIPLLVISSKYNAYLFGVILFEALFVKDWAPTLWCLIDLRAMNSYSGLASELYTWFYCMKDRALLFVNWSYKEVALHAGFAELLAEDNILFLIREKKKLLYRYDAVVGTVLWEFWFDHYNWELMDLGIINKTDLQSDAFLHVTRRFYMSMHLVLFLGYACYYYGLIYKDIPDNYYHSMFLWSSIRRKAKKGPRSMRWLDAPLTVETIDYTIRVMDDVRDTFSESVIGDDTTLFLNLLTFIHNERARLRRLKTGAWIKIARKLMLKRLKRWGKPRKKGRIRKSLWGTPIYVIAENFYDTLDLEGQVRFEDMAWTDEKVQLMNSAFFEYRDFILEPQNETYMDMRLNEPDKLGFLFAIGLRKDDEIKNLFLHHMDLETQLHDNSLVYDETPGFVMLEQAYKFMAKVDEKFFNHKGPRFMCHKDPGSPIFYDIKQPNTNNVADPEYPHFYILEATPVLLDAAFFCVICIPYMGYKLYWEYNVSMLPPEFGGAHYYYEWGYIMNTILLALPLRHMFFDVPEFELMFYMNHRLTPNTTEAWLCTGTYWDLKIFMEFDPLKDYSRIAIATFSEPYKKRIMLTGFCKLWDYILPHYGSLELCRLLACKYLVYGILFYWYIRPWPVYSNYKYKINFIFIKSIKNIFLIGKNKRFNYFKRYGINNKT